MAVSKAGLKTRGDQAFAIRTQRLANDLPAELGLTKSALRAPASQLNSLS